ncbi:MAG: deoxyguanosinetriphosphate triphosphohydrolase [Pseudoclavibacter sp.]
MKKAKYTPFDRERLSVEVHHTSRNDFERDRGRIIHSSSLRRLSAKTGVFSPMVGMDFVRNRLTHTLEVAQIGRELGKDLGLSANLADTACLGHDLGHPPFGHNGETALAEWAVRIGGFEGNAQTIRLVTRLETKRVVDGRSYGLNLTRASLDALLKYPWGLAEGERRADATGGPLKYNVYDDDRAVFDWVRQGAPAGHRCVEAQVMDISDDIAYCVHDYEDAVVEGYVDPAFLADPRHLDGLIRDVIVWTGSQQSEAELEDALRRLQAMPLWFDRWELTRANQAQLKDLTSELIGRFCQAVVEATRTSFPEGSLNRFGADVVVPPGTQAEITVLKGVVGTFIMSAGSLRPYYERQREMLLGLLDTIWAAGPTFLEPTFAELWDAAGDDRARRRVAVDQVASLTDVSASRWFDRYCGPHPTRM